MRGRRPQPWGPYSAPGPDKAVDEPGWTPRTAPSTWPRPGIEWLGGLSRTSAIVWILATIAIVQAAVIVLWLRPSSSAAAAGMGSIVVTSEPPGAVVLIDDLPRGVTPLTVSLSPGVHDVIVGLDDTMRNKSLNVAAGSEAAVHFDIGPATPAKASPTLTPALTGTLNISTEPGGAQVFVDGRRRGVSPVSVTDLEPGTHVVTVRDSRRSVDQRVTVGEGAVATLMISMSARSEFESGSLAIKSPIPVQIRERGSLLGTSDTPAVLLPTGRHNLELINPDLNYRAERTVEIQPGRRASIELTMPNGVVHINAIPWAQVSLGTRALGETPIANATVPIGTHELVFRHPELGEQRHRVVVRAGTPTRVGVDLRKGQ